MTYAKSAKTIEQRKQAARTHGAYAYRDNGPAALEPAQRSRLAELEEKVQERPGLIELMQERVLKTVLVCELLESFIQEEAAGGKQLTEIPALKQLPAFWNSAQRALSSLYNVMPDDKGILDISEAIQKVVENEQTS